MSQEGAKNLALTNGLVGLIGGIILLIAIWLMGLSFIVNDGFGGFVTVLIYIIKIAILVLGIIGSISFKTVDAIHTAPSVLLIVGGAISLIPLLGWVGGILAIIGGSMYLSEMKQIEA
ncbi:hypothetical protein [Lactobacillus sp. PV034]|uniref:hypothetical protein n=1 Tax=Lactobacillus sp. PV034 TaxID=2594495 RepID=UPI00223F071C|nr:hypothetical protein [Lactobacillus sp. PV034]QNQ80356.1 hypothetical protein FP432_01700 [Lactobacillus sp. PV034]